MSITTAAVSKVTANDAHFLIDGVIHEVPLTSWRGASLPRMGDTVEVVFGEGGRISRFFPSESGPNREVQSEAPKPTFRRPQYREEDVEVLGNPYSVWRRHGIVVSADSQTHTSISTGYRTMATGQVVANIQSSEYTTSEIRLLHEDGSVKDYEFSEKFKIRDGDEISICYIGERSAETGKATNGWPLGIQNHTTGRWLASTFIWNVGDTHHKLRFHRALAKLNSFKGLVIHCAATSLLGMMFHGSLAGAFWGFAGLLTFVAHCFLLGVIAATSGQKKVREVTQQLLEAF